MLPTSGSYNPTGLPRSTLQNILRDPLGSEARALWEKIAQEPDNPEVKAILRMADNPNGIETARLVEGFIQEAVVPEGFRNEREEKVFQKVNRSVVGSMVANERYNETVSHIEEGPQKRAKQRRAIVAANLSRKFHYNMLIGALTKEFIIKTIATPRKAEDAEIEAAKLMAAPSPAPKGQGKRTRGKKRPLQPKAEEEKTLPKKEPPKGPSQEEREQIAASLFVTELQARPAPYLLGGRLKRFYQVFNTHRDKNDAINRIRQFRDWKNGVEIYKYKQKPGNAVYEQLFCHTLFGAEKVIADPKLREMYTVEDQGGYGIVAELGIGNKPKMMGMVTYGLRGNEEKITKLTHLHFKKMEDLPPEMATLKAFIAKKSKNKEASEEDGWTHTISSEFSVRYKRVIVLTYYKPQNNKEISHTLWLYPQDLQAKLY